MYIARWQTKLFVLPMRFIMHVTAQLEFNVEEKSSTYTSYSYCQACHLKFKLS